ncbi:hypothetical protein BX600DRAFT_546895 [Xylariales sp. PMI_506]|nr:hypothetical protein BX600DRAFT_546895 [Xylariales sp. PMI_506]
MALSTVTQDSRKCGNPQLSPMRPRFDSNLTADRLREGAAADSFSMESNIKKGRKSVFTEVGLSEDKDDDPRESVEYSDNKDFAQVTGTDLGTRTSTDRETLNEGYQHKGVGRWLSKLAPGRRPRIRAASTAPPPTVPSLQRLSTIAMLIAVVLPAISYVNGPKKVEFSGADAGLVRSKSTIMLEDRADSPVDVCLRWAHQSTILNGTVYIYGGEAKTAGDQTNNTWNNNFLTLDLTTSWPISSPALTGLPQPSGPPAVALGYLWNDYNNLFLYGGEFADNPYASPVDVSTWVYNIAAHSWTEYSNPQTSAGEYSTDSGVPIQRAAEGAGISVPELGLSWYFGGHLDLSTTPGWPETIPRVYLKSLLEFTHPGYINEAVYSLQSTGAPVGGTYRNITEGGIQGDAVFSERADGSLVFVPGWGSSGILLGLGGGSTEDNDTADSFTSMETIDVYDIASSTWYHQQTSGQAPGVRVNPCSVIFSAPDASSFNIYMYGGQNLLPVAGQIQYSDMWILTIPSFTWISVPNNTAGQPSPRAGHSCHARDGQIVIVGGYIGQTTDCDSPGIYAFNASSLQWENSFTAAEHSADFDVDNSVLAGSYGYVVPDSVVSVIGGGASGGASATTPASGPATAGPFATGKPPVFTITQAGSTATVTNWAPTQTGTAPGNGTLSSSASEPTKTNGGLVAAGVAAGFLGLLACYLGFCTWLYRRQVAAYKKHMMVSKRYNGADDVDVLGGAGLLREKLRKHRRGSSSAESADQFGWVGQLGEPKWVTTSDEPSPGSGTGSGSGGRPRPSEDRNPWSWTEHQPASMTPATGSGSGGIAQNAGLSRMKSAATRSTTSGSSTEALLEGREPNFFSVVMGPRRALRVVNNFEGEYSDLEVPDTRYMMR